MIEASCLRDPDGDCLVVETDELPFRIALRELFFEERDGRHIKRFPTGTLSDGIVRRFESHLEPLLRQAACLDAVPWESALLEAARRLDEASVEWWLAGSAALAVRGVPIAPRDLDLVVLDEGAAATATALEDALIEPAVAVEGWFCRWWGRAWIGARVEWVGGVTEAADQPLPTDFGLVAAASLNRVGWNDFTILVPPLELQRAVSERRGLTDRVRLIDSFMGL